MCTCSKDAEKKIEKLIVKDLKKKGVKIAKVSMSGFSNKLLSLTGGGWTMFSLFEYIYIPFKRNGQMAAKSTTVTQRLKFNYCPFCGEKINTD